MPLPRSSTTERHGALLAHLTRVGEASIADLSRDLQVSEVSVRRDLEFLASRNLVRRTRGGAQSVARPGQVSVFDARLRTNIMTKQRIGALAAGLVQPGDTILLDSGTTVLEVARHLQPSLLDDGGLTVITRSLAIAAEFRYRPRLRLFVLGGLYLHEYDTFVGQQVADALDGLHVRTLFIGSDGMSAARGLTTDNVLEAPLFRAMSRIADRVVVVADASKIGLDKLQATVPFDSIHAFVTDESAPAEFLDMLRARGVEVIVASC
ncbi:MAG: DeoR/GlpR family DNA-binding transcription regulator [Nitrososphaerales archaeon]